MMGRSPSGAGSEGCLAKRYQEAPRRPTQICSQRPAGWGGSLGMGRIVLVEQRAFKCARHGLSTGTARPEMPGVYTNVDPVLRQAVNQLPVSDWV